MEEKIKINLKDIAFGLKEVDLPYLSKAKFNDLKENK